MTQGRSKHRRPESRAGKTMPYEGRGPEKETPPSLGVAFVSQSQFTAAVH